MLNSEIHNDKQKSHEWKQIPLFIPFTFETSSMGPDWTMKHPLAEIFCTMKMWTFQNENSFYAMGRDKESNRKGESEREREREREREKVEERI